MSYRDRMDRLQEKADRFMWYVGQAVPAALVAAGLFGLAWLGWFLISASNGTL